MDISEIKIGEKYRIISDDDFEGECATADDFVKCPQFNSNYKKTEIKVETDDNSIFTISPDCLAPIIPIQDFKKIYDLEKELSKYSHILYQTIDSILNLLHFELIDYEYDFDFDKNILCVNGRDYDGNGFSCSFPLQYLYEDNWYKNYLKEKVEKEKAKKETEEKLKKEKETKAKKWKEEYDLKEYLRLKEKYEKQNTNNEE